MNAQGVRIHLVSRSMTTNMTTQEKIRYILDEVKEQKILVLEDGLTPMEEAKLIESTMVEIDPDTFIGIEMESHPKQDDQGNWFTRLLQRSSPSSMTVVGPADMLQTVHKDGSTIQAMVVTGQAGEEVPVAGA